DAVRGHGFTQIRFAPDSDTLLGWNGGGVRLWQTSTGRERTLKTVPGQLGFPTFTPDSKTVVYSDGDGALTFHDIASGNVTRRIAMPGVVLSMSFTTDGRYLATGNANGTVGILRLEPRQGPALRPEPDIRPLRPVKPPVELEPGPGKLDLDDPIRLVPLKP